MERVVMLPAIGTEIFDDRILVKKDKVEEQKTKGGIIIPETVVEERAKSAKGVVLIKGPGLKGSEEAMEVCSVGDTVFFSQYSGTEIEIAGEEFHIIRRADIMGKFSSE